MISLHFPFDFQAFSATIHPFFKTNVSLHTIPEYNQALRANIGVEALEAEVLGPAPPYLSDVISVLQRGVELWQFRDIGDLDTLKTVLPERLVSPQPDLNDRIEILRFVQKPNGLARLSKQNSPFSELLKEKMSKEDRSKTPLAVARELRRRVETLIWEVNDLLIAQLKRDISQ